MLCASELNMTTRLILLARTLACDIASGRGLTLFFDNDGTVCPFVTDPKDVKIDPVCYAALVRLAHLPNVTVTSLTGREVHEARDLMLTPDYEVQDGDGTLLAPAEEKRLFFTIIGSHGVETLAPDSQDGSPGLLTRHAFSAAENAFISAFQDTARSFQTKHPTLTVEIKHGAVGINAATLGTAQEADRTQILEDIAAEMTDLLDAPQRQPCRTGAEFLPCTERETRNWKSGPLPMARISASAIPMSWSQSGPRSSCAILWAQREPTPRRQSWSTASEAGWSSWFAMAGIHRPRRTPLAPPAPCSTALRIWENS